MKLSRPTFIILGAALCCASLLSMPANAKKASNSYKPTVLDTRPFELLGQLPAKFVELAGKQQIAKHFMGRNNEPGAFYASFVDVETKRELTSFGRLFKGNAGYNYIDKRINHYSYGIACGYKVAEIAPEIVIGEAAPTEAAPLSIQSVFATYGEYGMNEVRPLAGEVLDAKTFEKYRLRAYISTNDLAQVTGWLNKASPPTAAPDSSSLHNYSIILHGKAADSEMVVELGVPAALKRIAVFERAIERSTDGMGSVYRLSVGLNPAFDLKKLGVAGICLKQNGVPFGPFVSGHFTYRVPVGDYIALDDYIAILKSGAPPTTKPNILTIKVS